MTEVNGSSHAGSQPASGGHGSNGSMTGGFELISGSIMGIGGAAGVSPPVSTVGITSMMDITLEQALIRMQDLARENAELRDYLKENNEMMKKQFETLSLWKQKVHEANVMNRDKFEQTRALITALRSENEDLQKKMKEKQDNEASLCGKIKLLETEVSVLKLAKPTTSQLSNNVYKQAEEQGVEVGEEETQMRETVYVASVEKEERISELEEEMKEKNEELEHLKERILHLEHESSQFRQNTEQLLKDLQTTQDLKQQIQKENQQLMQDNVELRQQLQSFFTGTKNSLPWAPGTVHLSSKEVQIPSKQVDSRLPRLDSSPDGGSGNTPSHTADYWQDASGTVTAEVEQLRMHLNNERMQVQMLTDTIKMKEEEISSLENQIKTTNEELEKCRREHSEQLVQVERVHAAQVEQIECRQVQESMQQQQQAVTTTHAEDVQTLRSQVLTLINEVHEVQNKLTAAQKVIETKNTKIKELEVYATQMMEEDYRRLDQMQQAHAMAERLHKAEQKDHEVTKRQLNELRLAFNQLISDYKEVLDTFEQYRSQQDEEKLKEHDKNQKEQHMEQVSHLMAQVLGAEEAINLRDERISRLQQELKDKEEVVTVFKAQAEVFQCDFAAERDARTRLAAERDQLASELESLQVKNQGLLDQLTSYTQRQLAEMQLRATTGQNRPSSAQMFYPYSQYPNAQSTRERRISGPNMEVGGMASSGQTTGLADGLPGHQVATREQVYAVRGQDVYAVRGQGYQQPGGQGYYGTAAHGTSGPDYIGGGHYGQPSQNFGQAGSGQMRSTQPRQHDEEEPQQFVCPSCECQYPDYDTLNIHVQDCLEQRANET